jgi:hypothetical protein
MPRGRKPNKKNNKKKGEPKAKADEEAKGEADDDEEDDFDAMIAELALSDPQTPPPASSTPEATPALPNFKPRRGRPVVVTESFERACIDGDVARVKRMVGRGHVADALPLMLAAAHGHIALVRRMVKELGADVDKADGNDATPLHAAASKGHLEVVQCLVKELGADVDKATKDGGTPLHMAAQEGHLEGVRCLVKELGADVDKARGDGSTPLFVAARGGHLEVVQCLVKELGADVDKAAKYGATPLHAAAAAGHDNVARYLTRRCADPQVSSDVGTAADVAGKITARGEDPDLTEWLEGQPCANSGCDKDGKKKCVCKVARYCCEECQVAHWPEHKKSCSTRKA